MLHKKIGDVCAFNYTEGFLGLKAIMLILLNIMGLVVVFFSFDWSRGSWFEGILLNLWMLIPLSISYVLIKVYELEQAARLQKIRTHTAWVLGFFYGFVLLGTLVYPFVIHSFFTHVQQMMILSLLLPAILIFQGVLGSVVGFFCCHFYRRQW